MDHPKCAQDSMTPLSHATVKYDNDVAVLGLKHRRCDGDMNSNMSVQRPDVNDIEKVANKSNNITKFEVGNAKEKIERKKKGQIKRLERLTLYIVDDMTTITVRRLFLSLFFLVYLYRDVTATWFFCIFEDKTPGWLSC